MTGGTEASQGKDTTGQKRHCPTPASSEAIVSREVTEHIWAKVVQPRLTGKVGRPGKREETGLPLSTLVATCYMWLFKYTEIKLQFLVALATFKHSQLYLLNGTTLGSTART